LGQTILKDKDKNLVFFLFKFLAIWLSWKVVSFVLGEEKVPIQQRLVPPLSRLWEALNDSVRVVLLNVSEWVLHLMGYKTFNDGYVFGTEGYGGVALGNYCIGFQLMYYFTFLVAISDMSGKRKAFGLISGLLIIQTLNIIRLVGLNFLIMYKPEWIALSHDYIFTITVLGIMLIYYYYLINRK
jgi:exosortase/archaeosortase family protein